MGYLEILGEERCRWKDTEFGDRSRKEPFIAAEREIRLQHQPVETLQRHFTVLFYTVEEDSHPTIQNLKEILLENKS